MPNQILHKRSSTPGAAPTAGQLAAGELALNLTDGKIFAKKADGTVAAFPAVVDKLVVKGAGITSAASALNVTDSTDASLLFVRNDGNIGIGQSAPTYKLEVNGSFAATTKSFRIAHPTKPNHVLEYGSLEAPYHGVRLTGRAVVTESPGKVLLPDYLKDLVHDDETLTIQITNYRHGKLLYVSEIDLQRAAFFVACNTSSDAPLEFFWSLTAVRKDVAPMTVEQEG